MTKTELKKKTKDELIEMVEKQGIILTEYYDDFKALEKEVQVLRKSLVRVLNEKANIVDRQKIDYLSIAIQLHHEVCEKIRKTLMLNEDSRGVIHATEIRNLLNKIERGEV